MLETTWVRWIVAAIVAFAVVALLAWARNDAGIDDRVPDPEDAASATVLVDLPRAAV